MKENDRELKRLKTNKAAYICIAAAVCLAVGLTFVWLKHRSGRVAAPETAAFASAAPTAAESTHTPAPTIGTTENADTPAPTIGMTENADTPAPTVDLTGKKIVYGSGNVTIPEWVPRSGEYYLFGSLEEELEKDENADALFYVRIEFFGFAKAVMRELRQELLNRLLAAEHDPVLIEMMKEFNRWWSDVGFPNASAEEIKAFESGNTEPFFEGFFDYIAVTVSKQKSREYREAMLRLIAAQYEYEFHDVPQEVIAEYNAEIARLSALGYEIDTSSLHERAESVCAYLTREQIENFAADPEYFYYIYLADKGLMFIPE